MAVDRELVEMMTSVFAAQPEVDETEIGWDTTIWNTLSELGLTRLTGSEDTGGSGAGWPESAELLRAAAAYGIPVPIVEHDLLSGWLLEAAQLPVGDHRRTAVALDEDGVAHGVGWAAYAERVVVTYRVGGEDRVADVPADQLAITPGRNVAGEPRDSVAVDAGILNGSAVPESVVAQFFLRGALARAVQVTAALEAITELSVAHTGERTQFGRPLARFQAVQNLVADMAAQASLARAATDAAIRAVADDALATPEAEFLVAVARSCAGHAASVVVRNAHQVHGAIGTTREHRLHRFTLPALAWRSEFGSLRHWDQVVTDAAIGAGRDGLWRLAVSGRAD